MQPVLDNELFAPFTRSVMPKFDTSERDYYAALTLNAFYYMN